MAIARRGADALVEALISAGVRTIFGVPGDTGVTFYDALFQLQDRIEHILARDERHAAAMADAYARTSNAIGVVEVSSGGGVSYVVGGLGEALASSVPVLVIASDIHSSSRNTGALTESDQLALFGGCTKWATRVDRAADVHEVVRQAIDVACAGRPGPVAVVVPESTLDEAAPAASATADQTTPAGPPQSRPEAHGALVDEAARLLLTAHQPAMLVGSGIHLSAAWEALLAFAEASGIPVATTIHGKGSIAETHPLSLGVAGNNGGSERSNSYLAGADVALLIGTRANATDTCAWTGPSRHRAKIIQIDVSADRAGRNYPGSIPLVGDARAVLIQLTTFFAEPAADTAVRPAARNARAAVDEEEEEEASLQPSQGSLLPERVIRIVQEHAPLETVVVADPGTPTPNVATYWQVRRAGRTVVIPRGHGPMGYALPAAIGVTRAVRDVPVVCFTADGSFAMSCGELETARRLDSPILFVQFTNNSLGWIKMLQHLYFGQRYFGVDPGPIDAVQVAAACGLRAARPASEHELGDAVRRFFDEPEPTYLDVTVPHIIDHVPPVPAWADALAGHGERPVY